MKIKILKPIRISNVPLVKDQTIDVPDSAAKIYIKRKFAEAVKEDSKKEDSNNAVNDSNAKK